MGGKNSGIKSTFDKILDLMMNQGPEVSLDEMGLDEVEKNIIIRFNFLDSLRRQHFPYIDNVQLWNFYSKRFPNMSRRQFYYDLQNAEKIFGKSRVINKEYERTLSIEYYERLASLAQQRQDIATAIKAKKEADTLKGLYEDEEINEHEGTAVHLLQLLIHSSGQKPVMKMLELENVLKLDKDIIDEIMEQTDVPDVKPDDIIYLLDEE